MMKAGGRFRLPLHRVSTLSAGHFPRLGLSDLKESSLSQSSDFIAEDTMGNVVDEWMARYDNPQKPLVEAVRQAILKADKRMGETIKWQAPTFTYKGNLASFYPKSKAHVSLMFHVGAQIPGDFPSLEGTGDVSRVMKFADAADLKAKTPELKRLVKAWCDWKDS